jgi:hypothetical protein
VSYPSLALVRNLSLNRAPQGFCGSNLTVYFCCNFMFSLDFSFVSSVVREESSETRIVPGIPGRALGLEPRFLASGLQGRRETEFWALNKGSSRRLL